MRFRDKIIIVTGAASGIGRSTAERLAREGASVVLCDRAAPEPIAGAEPERTLSFAVDVSDAAAVRAVFDEAAARLGGLDGLANVAGVFRSGALLGETGSDATFDELFDTNVRGVASCIRASVPHLQRRGGGSIVTVASQSAKVLRFEQALYGASKAAASYLTKAAGLELAASGIRCNVVHPGVTESGMTRPLWNQGLGSEESHVAGSLPRFRVPIPLGRIGQPDHVAACICFLLSDEAAHVTMSEMIVDAGSHLIA